MASSLPPEIIVQIIEHTRPGAHQSFDDVTVESSNIGRYTLVCRSWSGPAQHSLFRLVAPDRSDGAQALVRALQQRPDLARAVEKLRLQLEGSWDMHATATALALCSNLRHFAFLVRYWQDPVVSFTDGQIGAIASGTPDVRRLTARVFSTGSDQCRLVPQLIAAWPRLEYLDLRGRGCASDLPVSLRELRLMSSYILSIDSIQRLDLRTVYINSSNPMLNKVIVPTLRKLCIIISDEFEPATMTPPKLLPFLQELVLVSQRWLPHELNVPANIERVGFIMRLVRSRPDALVKWILNSSDHLRIVTVYIHVSAVAYENECISKVETACSKRHVELRIRPIADLWDVPSSY